MLFKSKRSEPQEVPGAPFEDECGELSDDALDTIYGGQGFGPNPDILEPREPYKICGNCQSYMPSDYTNCEFSDEPL